MNTRSDNPVTNIPSEKNWVHDEMMKVLIIEGYKAYLRAKEVMDHLMNRLKELPKPIPWPGIVQNGVIVFNPAKILAKETVEIPELLNHEDTLIIIAPAKMQKKQREKLLELMG